jgi:hypothetical protein
VIYFGEIPCKTFIEKAYDEAERVINDRIV